MLGFITVVHLFFSMNINNNHPSNNNGNNNLQGQAVPKDWLVWDTVRCVVPCTKHSYQLPQGIERVCIICEKDVSDDFARVGAMACNHVHCFACMQRIVDSRLLTNRCAICRSQLAERND